MSTARTMTAAQPTAEQRRADNLARLDQLRRRRNRLVAMFEAELGEWKAKFSGASKFFAGIDVPEVATEGSGDLSGAVVTATRALTGAEAQVAAAAAACMAEYQRLLARNRASLNEVKSATRAADRGGGVQRRTRGPVDLGEELAAPPPAPPTPDVPDAGARVDKVAEILSRGLVPCEVASELFNEARESQGRVAYESILARARRSVHVARQSEARRVADRRQAAELLEQLVGVPGAAAERWRHTLTLVIDDDGDLPDGSPAAVQSVIHRSLKVVLVAELVRLGMVNVEEKGDQLTGWVDHDGPGCSRVLVDDEGVVVTAVVPLGTPPAEVRRAELDNCGFADRLAEGMTAQGVLLQTRSDSGVGTLPVRVDPSIAPRPPAVPASEQEAHERPTVGPGRRSRRRHNTNEERRA